MKTEAEQRPVITVTAAVLHFGAVLLVKTQQGDDELWSLPATAQRWGEALPQAVERGVREATGVTVTAGDILQAYDVIDAAEGGGHRVVIEFEAAYRGGDLVPGTALLDVAWASGLALRSMPVEQHTAALLSDLGVLK